MELSLPSAFIILALNPNKGRIVIDHLHFRYTLTGAVLLDLYASGEITLDQKKIIPSFKRNGSELHDMIAEKMESAGRNWSISRWLQVLTRKRKEIFNEYTGSLIRSGILTHERKYFLNIIPYNR